MPYGFNYSFLLAAIFEHIAWSLNFAPETACKENGRLSFVIKIPNHLIDSTTFTENFDNQAVILKKPQH